MRIRPFEPGDAQAVASLWQYWFRTQTREPDADLVDLARRVYVEHPNRAEGVTSLVAEDGGEVRGFLGVTVTPVAVDGREATLAGVFPSVVDPDAPTAVASLLLRTCLRGPQAFTFSDGGHVKFERIWETLGGRIAQLQSLRWVKVFRPARLATNVVTDGRWRHLRPVVAPFAAGVDWAARRIASSRLGTASPPSRGTPRSVPLAGEPASPSTLEAANARIHDGLRLRPIYGEGYVRWLMREMARVRSQGTLTATLLRDSGGEAVGYYVYYLKTGGVSRVFALEAAPRHLDGVVDHLFAHAEAGGAAALIGRLAPRLRSPMEARGCFVHLGGSLFMVHARDASLMDDAELGRLAVSRLDGENWFWWAIDRPAG